MRLPVLAFRNLARNRRRTALSLLVVAAGAVALLLTAGFVSFSFHGLREAIIHGGLGHLEVVAPETADASSVAGERAPGAGLAEWAETQARIEELDGVLAAAGQIQLMGLVQKDETSVSFLGVGVEPEREERMGFETKLRQGEGLPAVAPEAGEDAVVLAAGLARALDARVGDVVTLLGMTADGMLNAWDVTVAGILTTGVQDLDTRFLKVHLATAQRLLETDRVSSLVVGLDRTERTEEVARKIASATPDLRVLGWRERAPFYDQVKNLYTGIFWFLGSIVFVLVVLSASNTLLMSILERVRELGTLLAIGTGRGQLAALVLWEALWLGLFGGLAGSGLGFVAIVGLNALRIEMPPPPGATSPIDLRLAVVPEAFVGTIVLMLVVLVLAALVPIVRTLRLRIVEALGHV